MDVIHMTWAFAEAEQDMLRLQLLVKDAWSRFAKIGANQYQTLQLIKQIDDEVQGVRTLRKHATPGPRIRLISPPRETLEENFPLSYAASRTPTAFRSVSSAAASSSTGIRLAHTARSRSPKTNARRKCLLQCREKDLKEQWTRAGVRWKKIDQEFKASQTTLVRQQRRFETFMASSSVGGRQGLGCPPPPPSSSTSSR